MKKAKVDAIIKRKVAEAYQRGRAEGASEERKNYELMILPAKGVTVLGEIPKRHIALVALTGGRGELVDFERPSPHLMSSRPPPLARFRAVQKCWTTQNGPGVSWYEWQFEGLQS